MASFQWRARIQGWLILVAVLASAGCGEAMAEWPAAGTFGGSAEIVGPVVPLAFHTTNPDILCGSYPSALPVPAAQQRLFALFPRRGILSTTVVSNQDLTFRGGN